MQMTYEAECRWVRVLIQLMQDCAALSDGIGGA
jgi:hypothetical protein